MRRSYGDQLASRVLVNLKTNKTFRGILWSEVRGLLVLRDATLLEHDTETPVDGEVVIERSNIDFVQVLA